MAKTAAERQREKRERDTVTEENVTCHGGDVTPDQFQGDLVMTASEVLARQHGYKGDWPPGPLALPGDPNYWGVCKQVDGQWVVKPDPPVPVADMTDAELQIRLKSYQGASWINSPEHKEVARRRAVSELTDETLPEHGEPIDVDKDQYMGSARACVG